MLEYQIALKKLKLQLRELALIIKEIDIHERGF